MNPSRFKYETLSPQALYRLTTETTGPWNDRVVNQVLVGEPRKSNEYPVPDEGEGQDPFNSAE